MKSNLVERISNYTEAEVEESRNLFKDIFGKCTPYFGTDHDDIIYRICHACNADLDQDGDEITKAERTMVWINCHKDHSFHLNCVSKWFINKNTCPISPSILVI